MREYFTRMLIFTTLLTAIALFAEYYLSGYLRDSLKLPYADIITAVLTFIIAAPFLRAILVNRTRRSELFPYYGLKNAATIFRLWCSSY